MVTAAAAPSYPRPVPVEELGSWCPMPLAAVVALFEPATFRWWVSGGIALELHLGDGWRDHDDTDVGICRRDTGDLPEVINGWDVWKAAGGRLTPWHGDLLDAGRQENNLWCRPTPGDPWVLDVTVGEGDDAEWIYRRDERVRAPWPEAVLRSSAGVPYLAPELQLLFKSTDIRAKDDLDARMVIPRLEEHRATRLRTLLPPEHEWQKLLGAG